MVVASILLICAFVLAAMATTRNRSMVGDDEGPTNVDPDRTKDGRSIFKTTHYNRIPVTARGAIRILKIVPGPPEQMEVQCELIPGTILSEKDRLPQEASGIQFKPYDALSWCWSKAPADSWIRILEEETSYLKYVQCGLVGALRTLRDENHARYLWVDAICINQENTTEKNVSISPQVSTSFHLRNAGPSPNDGRHLRTSRLRAHLARRL